MLTPLLRNIVGQTRSAFSFRSVMDDRRVLVANLAKGKITEDGSMLLGATLTTLFQLAAYSRADIPAAERVPFVLFADEFQSYATRSFAELLSEARKFGCGVVLANQFGAQIDPIMRHAVLANAGTVVAFALGPEDAEALAGVLGPELSAHDLGRLGPHRVALQLSVRGVTSVPFTAETLAPREAPKVFARTIRRVSRERHGQTRSLMRGTL